MAVRGIVVVRIMSISAPRIIVMVVPRIPVITTIDGVVAFGGRPVIGFAGIVSVERDVVFFIVRCTSRRCTQRHAG